MDDPIVSRILDLNISNLGSKRSVLTEILHAEGERKPIPCTTNCGFGVICQSKEIGAYDNGDIEFKVRRYTHGHLSSRTNSSEYTIFIQLYDIILVYIRSTNYNVINEQVKLFTGTIFDLNNIYIRAGIDQLVRIASKCNYDEDTRVRDLIVRKGTMVKSARKI